MYLKRLKQIPCFVILCIWALYQSPNSHAQQLSSEQIKAAYLFNFIKHVQWPNEREKLKFTIAIYQDPKFYQVISKALEQRYVKGKPITVISITNIDKTTDADVVFTSKVQIQALAQLASELRRTNTLLVTDNSTDKHNVMINLVFNSDSSAISFEVNKSNIIYENLVMSKELLLLGGTEIDVATLYRETELAMQKMRERERKLNLELTTQQAKIVSTGTKLKKLNEVLNNREIVALDHQKSLDLLKNDIASQKQSIIGKESQLIDLLEQLSIAKTELINQQNAVKNKESENITMAKRIDSNKNILEQQQFEINQQEQKLKQKNVESAQDKAVIDQQQFYLLLMTALTFIVLLFFSLVVWLFIKNKKTTQKLSHTLSNLQEMQEQLIQSEKLASLGKLTAGVAHEINTPLGIVVTSTSLALDKTLEIKGKFDSGSLSKSAMSSYFSAMEHAAQLNTSSLERVIELLNNFKQVAADQVVGEVRSIKLADYIDEIMQSLSAELHKYRVDYHYLGKEDITIKTIPGALAQIITNLVTNSLKHGFDGRNSGNISINVEQENDHVLFTYQDDGVGMKQEVLQNIFEPFFTTKRNSGGTGLGMNIVHNIITQKLQGQIKIISEQGEGSSFIINLPYKLD